MENSPDLKIGDCLNRKEIAALFGGSIISYLPTVNKEVVAVCVDLKMNPHAPNVIICGNEKAGPRIAATARQLTTQTNALPIFIKKESAIWEYQGHFKVKKDHQDGVVFQEYLKGTGRIINEVGWVIEFESLPISTF